MAALVAAIHAFVDARDKPGRDGCADRTRLPQGILAAVMAALVAAIHAFVDARDKPGRDGCGGRARRETQPNL